MRPTQHSKMPKETKENIILIQKKERIARMTEMQSMLKAAFKAGQEVDKEKFIAIYCMDTGISRRTMLEYLKILKALMGFEIEKEVIKPLK